MTDQKWSDRCPGELQQSKAKQSTEYVLGGAGKQTNDTERSGPR